MQQPPTTSGASGSWSDQIQSRYQCALSDDLIRWFDNELWKSDDGPSNGRFASAISPQDLLCHAPTAIWPALMPCDFLPILGNEMGDWLCVRVASDNNANEIVHWYHGGGDWIPWGRTLSEAILFDHIRRRLPGGSRDHAISADASNSPDDRPAGTITQWAISNLNGESSAQIRELCGVELADAMINNRWCEPAVHCQLVINALDNPLLSDAVVESWKIDDADEVQRSLFDNSLLSDEKVATVSTGGLSRSDVLSQQDWDAVERHCKRVTEIAPELAWGWDLLGYTQERRGDNTAAIESYRNGLQCSIFTDQTVRVRTHGFNGDAQKFSAVRLEKLNYTPSDPDDQNYYQRLCAPTSEDRRDQVREFFSEQAEQAAPPTAYGLWKRAGWDLGAEPMISFAELLENAAASADEAGRSAQAAVALTHRACFRDRYGL